MNKINKKIYKGIILEKTAYVCYFYQNIASGVKRYSMKINTTALNYIKKNASPYKLHIIVLTVLSTVSGIMGAVSALFLRNVINNAVAKNEAAFWQSFIVMTCFIAAGILLSAAARRLSAYTVTSLENTLRLRLFMSILKGDYAEASKEHSGMWMNRLTSDASAVAGEAVGLLPGITGTAARLISAVVIIVSAAPGFLYVILAGGLIALLGAIKFRKKMKDLYKLVREKDGSLRMRLQDYLGSLVIVRTYAAEDTAAEDVSEKMNDYRAAVMRRTRFSNIMNIGFAGIMEGGYLFAAAFCGYAILMGTMDYGTFAAMLDLVGQVQGPLAGISGFVPRFVSLIGSAERLMEFDSEYTGKQLLPEPEKISGIEDFYASGFTGLGLDGVTFTYPGDEQPVLTDFSLFAEKNSSVALTGFSGCGKSTALKILMGLYKPDSGESYVLTQDGRIKDEELLKYRRLFAYVPQGNLLMSGTIRDVVAFSRRDLAGDTERINRALEISCALGFVSELEKGIDTELGENGAGLSEGQMQRLAIARAVFSGSPVLMLDECTSALDAETEKQLLENLRSLSGKTVLLVTHRRSAVDACDREISFGN